MPVASMKELREREDLKDKMTSDGPAPEGGIPREAMERPVDGERLPTMFHGLYHEKQIGALCAVHAMNNLVQERRFDEVELAAVAHRLDDAERALLGGELGGANGESSNVRSDGFFSVQVIVTALQGAGLASTQDTRAVKDPAKETGFIFNRREHWFALRRVGRSWFDLNSMHRVPKAMSETHLGLFFQAHEEQGYSIFAVRGAYPAHALDRDAAALKAAVAACDAHGAGGGPAPAAAAPAFDAFSGSGRSMADAPPLDPELAAAAAADPELAAAIAMSMSEAAARAPPKKAAADDVDEIRRKRLARFG